MQTKEPAKARARNLRVGQLVMVRSEAEILATLDENGELDGLPFMPEMLQYCGRQLRVDKLALKACDTINNSGMYRMDSAVHLSGVRCDGQAHGGCQAACLIYWKEAWLIPLPSDAQPAPAEPVQFLPFPVVRPGSAPCTVASLERATRAEAGTAEERFRCQATEMPRAASTHLAGWDMRQYIRDVTSRNARPLPMLRSVLILLFNKLQTLNGRLLPRIRLINHGKTYPALDGKLEVRTPKELLDLQPGELVEVKSKEEIFQTLDKNNANRGLRFNVEMLAYCGKRARVLRRVDRIIDEQTGRMLHFSNDCIVLEGVVCIGDYHQYCPRSIYSYWREIWLRRVEA